MGTDRCCVFDCPHRSVVSVQAGWLEPAGHGCVHDWRPGRHVSVLICMVV